MKKRSSGKSKRQLEKSNDLFVRKSDPAARLSGFIARVKSTKPIRYAVAFAILVTSLAGVLGFISGLVDKTSGIMVNLSIVKTKAADLVGILMQEPVDLREEYAKRPESFSQKGGAIFHRPVRLVGALAINNQDFSFTAPELITSRDNETGSDPYIYRAAGRIVLGKALSPAVSFSTDITKGIGISRRKVDAAGYAGYFGTGAGLVSVNVKTLNGDLGVENNGQNGQAGGDGALGYEIIDSEDASSVNLVLPGLPGRGGDGGNGGPILLQIGKISTDTRVELISKAGFGGKSSNKLYDGKSGNSGYIDFNGVHSVQDLTCAFVAFEHDQDYINGQLFGSTPSPSSSTSRRLISDFYTIMPSFNRTGITRSLFVMENGPFSIEHYAFWAYNHKNLITPPSIFDENKYNGYCTSNEVRLLKSMRYIIKPRNKGDGNKGDVAN